MAFFANSCRGMNPEMEVPGLPWTWFICRGVACIHPCTMCSSAAGLKVSHFRPDLTATAPPTHRNLSLPGGSWQVCDVLCQLCVYVKLECWMFAVEVVHSVLLLSDPEELIDSCVIALLSKRKSLLWLCFCVHLCSNTQWSENGGVFHISEMINESRKYFTLRKMFKPTQQFVVFFFLLFFLPLSGPVVWSRFLDAFTVYSYALSVNVH